MLVVKNMVVINRSLVAIVFGAFTMKICKNKLIYFMIAVCPSVYIFSNNSEITEEIFTTFELWKFTKFC
jgi:hypothetical protein